MTKKDHEQEDMPRSSNHADILEWAMNRPSRQLDEPSLWRCASLHKGEKQLFDGLWYRTQHNKRLDLRRVELELRVNGKVTDSACIQADDIMSEATLGRISHMLQQAAWRQEEYGPGAKDEPTKENESE